MDESQIRECFVTALNYINQMNQLIGTRLQQNQALLDAIEQQKQDQFSELSELILKGGQALDRLLFEMYENACIDKIYESGHGKWRDIAASLRIDAQSPVGVLLSADFLIHDIATQSVSETTQDAINIMQDVCEVVDESLARLQQILHRTRKNIELMLE